jgi:acetoin utilization protein AcuB
MSGSRLKTARDLRVRDVMRTDVATGARGETATQAWTRMRARGVDDMVVVEDDEVVGTLDARDLSGPTGGTHRRMGRTVGDLMHGDPALATPRTTIARAAALMRKRKVACLPVVERGKLVGLVTTHEMLGVLSRRG